MINKFFVNAFIAFYIPRSDKAIIVDRVYYIWLWVIKDQLKVRNNLVEKNIGFTFRLISYTKSERTKYYS